MFTGSELLPLTTSKRVLSQPGLPNFGVWRGLRTNGFPQGVDRNGGSFEVVGRVDGRDVLERAVSAEIEAQSAAEPYFQ